MLDFDGAIAPKTLEEWETIAIETIESSGFPPQLLVPLGLGAGFLISGLAPFMAIGLIPPFLAFRSAWIDNDRKSKMHQVSEKFAYAAVLGKAELQEYAHQFGTKTTIAQIDWAKRSGIPLSDPAEKLLARYKQKYKALPPAIEQPPTVDVAAIALPGADTPDTQPIGVNTRLGAVDIASLPQTTDEWWDSSPVAVVTTSANPVDYLIGDRLRTSLIVSVSGGGKDILLSNALREFLSKHRGFKVIVMDCKDDAKETGYYANLPNVRLHRLNVAVSSDGEVVEWVDRCLEEFLQLPERALLICNESTLIRAKAKRYVDAINGLVSSGDSREKYAWEAGQSAHLLDLCINGAARSRLRLLIIGLKGEEQQISAVLRAQCVDDTARSMSDIKGQLMRSPVGRAWCDGMRWFPMPVLENYSGYNRDKRANVEGFTPGSETVQPGSETVQPGSAPEPLNHGSNPVQWLNHCLEAEVQDSEPDGSGFSSDGSARFSPENLTFEDALNRINELKEVGLNQTQILAALWRVKKGGNKAYQDAVAQYKLLTGEK